MNVFGVLRCLEGPLKGDAHGSEIERIFRFEFASPLAVADGILRLADFAVKNGQCQVC